MTKRCSKCGQTKPISDFHLDSANKDGRASNCKPCRKALAAKRWKSPEAHKRQSERRARWNNAHPRKRMVSAMRPRAKKRGIPFNLKYTDFVIPDICPALGIPLFRGNGQVCANSPTFDRLVPERGYVAGNVIVVSHKANAMKNNAALHEMKRLVAFYEKVLAGGWPGYFQEQAMSEKCPDCGAEGLTVDEQAAGKCYDCQRLDKKTADLRRQLAERDKTIEELRAAITTPEICAGVVRREVETRLAAANAVIERMPKNWGDNTDTSKTVREILVYWLKANGYDGLCNSDMECGCALGDLIPCDAPCDKCEAAYEGPSPDSNFDFFMYPTQAAAEAAKGEK